MPTLQEQVENVRLAMLEESTNQTGLYAPIYDPNQMKLYCKNHGAPTLFNELLQMATPTRINRLGRNSHKPDDRERVVVCMIHQLGYSQSQRCNFMQQDIANFIQYHGLSVTGMHALHRLGVGVGVSTFYKGWHSTTQRHHARINQVIREALAKKKLMVVIIDDYTNIHTRRRCDFREDNHSHMATVLVRIFDLPAIPLQPHHPNVPEGINIQLLLAEFQENMSTLFSTFCATAPAQLNNTFFDAQQERLRLTTHMYGENNDIRLVRGVGNAYLIDCVEQDLKSLTNFGQATQIYLNTPLDEYLRHFNVLIPGDWPSQFYQRQLAYNAELHSPLRNTTPTMGPLHVSLNAQENVVRKFIIFFQRFYHRLFNKQLPLKPKPWRVTLLLELLYGGWTIIRPAVLARLRRFKDIQFLTLLNLVDHYSPLTLAIYSIYFKSNAFLLYNKAMMQVWVMYFVFQRRHYDKSPLVWLANVAHWRNTNPPLYNLLENSLHVFDEYPVENFHSLIRAQTNAWDTAATIQQRARWIDSTKHNLQHFATYFVPPRQAMLSHNKLRRLKVKSARYLLQVIQSICETPFAGEELQRAPRQRRSETRWRLPALFGQRVVTNVLLPLGFQWSGHQVLATRLQHHRGQTPPFSPNQQLRCDRSGCDQTAESPVSLYSCGHSFHTSCIAPDVDKCFVCEAGLLLSVRDKASVAQQAIFHPNANVGQDNPDASDSSEEEEDDVNFQVAEMTEAEAAVETDILLTAVANLPPVNLL